MEAFLARGWARLGIALADAELDGLRARADDLMLGRVRYPGFFFQMDAATGRYGDLEYGKGWQGPSLAYRKLEKLELDPLFREAIHHRRFEAVARRLIEGPIAIYRAVLFNKPASGGTPLPWHQDGGSMWGLDRPPVLQIWTALDDAPIESGCLEVVEGSHAQGLATPLGGLVPEEIAKERIRPGAIVSLPARAGESILIHNELWHRSGVNTTGRARRALSIAYMSAKTNCTRKRKVKRNFYLAFP